MENSIQPGIQKNDLIKIFAGALFLATVVAIGLRYYKPSERITRADLLIANHPIFGDANAPVTLVVFSDYQCPYSEKFYSLVEKDLRTEYVATGKLKIVMRDFPLEFHPAARPAAVAAVCAAEQNAYWQYHDALFDAQGKLDTLDFTALAKTLKLDAKKFSACLEQTSHDATIENDIAAGRTVGVEGTPGVFIGDQFFAGAYPYATFKKAVEKELSRKGL